MSVKIWTASADVRPDGIRRRGLLIGPYETAADADLAFRRLVGLAPVMVAPGIQWSTMAEKLVSRDAWNALMCEHHVREHSVFLCVRMDLPVQEMQT